MVQSVTAAARASGSHDLRLVTRDDPALAGWDNPGASLDASSWLDLCTEKQSVVADGVAAHVPTEAAVVTGPRQARSTRSCASSSATPVGAPASHDGPRSPPQLGCDTQQHNTTQHNTTQQRHNSDTTAPSTWDIVRLARSLCRPSQARCTTPHGKLPSAGPAALPAPPLRSRLWCRCLQACWR
jgi:hypothetical protein